MKQVPQKIGSVLLWGLPTLLASHRDHDGEPRRWGGVCK